MDCTVIQVIVCLYIIQGVLSRTVTITGSTTGLEGTNGTNLKCMFTKDDGDLLTSVTFSARNSSNQFDKIVLFEVLQSDITFYGLWFHLFGNVTQKITPITDQSTTAADIQINNLLCKHESEYQCEAAFLPKAAVHVVVVPSNITNITVQVKPFKPEIELLDILVDNDILPTTEYPPTGPESENNGTFTTVVPTQQNNSSEPSTISEGDKIIFVCSGNVGKPPASFKWEKIQSSGTIKTYNDTNTSIIYHSDNCSYTRISNITLQLFAEDNNATVRCVLESDISDEQLIADTDALEILYKVRRPNITKHPNQDMYGKETNSITLICNSDGNPKPSYVWSKNGIIREKGSVLLISNVTVNDNGTYMCNVSNYVGNEHMMYSTSVSIIIVEEIVTTTTRRTTTPAASGSTMKDEKSTTKNDNGDQTMSIIIGGVVAGIVVLAGIIATIVVVCKRKRRTKGYDNNLTDKRTKSSPKPQRSADPYCSINLEDKPQKDVRDENTYKENEKHNLQYLKHEEVKAKETKPSEAPDEYAVVDKTKHKYMNSVNKDEVPEDPYALQSEGVYDTANDRRHKPDDHAETYDTTDMKKKSQPANGSEGSQEPTAKSKAYENQSFIDDTNDNTKDDNKPLYQNEKTGN